ncbi:acetyl esterase/lipase [Actinoplanes lutulentus]|uniref:Acetyl esterase/lipase n=1 Tax=Actinoplanes lutulentus TaxID=1287878 RepID=A0A327ZAH2_9ACTN|nr:alpha/beta hydrolase [Actinoplanes lutulentus]MBB2947327.1 acetyl esterase/lipase [Actinoplanes lutulentus]RAK36602.1 acetyl esterase/lipase [Actinoplanes lutulentus]
MNKWVERTLFTALYVVATVAFLLVASTFLPTPVNVVGAILSSLPAYVITIALLLTAGAGWLWWCRRTRARQVLVVLTALTLLGGIVVFGQQLSLAHRENTDLDVTKMFALSDGDTAPDETVTYLRFNGEDVPLSVWRPVGGSQAGAPVIVMVHGGGWVSGSRLEGTPPGHARWFAEHGYLVISADYTLSNQQRHLWDVTESQIGCALAWTGANAQRFGGDLSRLSMVGDSAGGNLALQAAYKGNAGTLSPACEGTLPRVRAVSVLYPGADMADLYENSSSRTFLEQYLGGSPQQYPDRYAATTVTNHISTQAPPTLITVGTSDGLVPPKGSYKLYAKLQDSGVTSELIKIPHGQHVFDLPSAVGTQVWRQATLRWFTGHVA